MTHLWLATTSIPPSRRSTKVSRYHAISPRYSRNGGASASKVAKPQALMGGKLRHRYQAPALAIQLVVVGLLHIRHAGEPPVIAVGPAVIGAGKARGITRIGAAQPVAAMTAHIEEGADLARGVAHHQNRVFAHIAGQEIAGLRDLAVMAQKEPAAGEDALQLLLINLRLDEDAAAD